MQKIFPSSTRAILDIELIYMSGSSLDLIMIDILNKHDSFEKKIEDFVMSFHDERLLILSKIWANVYLSIKNIYVLPSLLDKSFSCGIPNTHTIFDESSSLLSSMTILSETSEKLCHFLLKYFPNKISKLQMILGELLTINKYKIIVDGPDDIHANFEQCKLDLLNSLSKTIHILIDK